MNLRAWSAVPVWSGERGCRANIGKSLTGTLSAPAISEAGRVFLARLLNRLSEKQLHDLFLVARFPARAGIVDRKAADDEVKDWVAAFKRKVAEVTRRSCDPARARRPSFVQWDSNS